MTDEEKEIWEMMQKDAGFKNTIDGIRSFGQSVGDWFKRFRKTKPINPQKTSPVDLPDPHKTTPVNLHDPQKTTPVNLPDPQKTTPVNLPDPSYVQSASKKGSRLYGKEVPSWVTNPYEQVTSGRNYRSWLGEGVSDAFDAALSPFVGGSNYGLKYAGKGFVNEESALSTHGFIRRMVGERAIDDLTAESLIKNLGVNVSFENNRWNFANIDPATLQKAVDLIPKGYKRNAIRDATRLGDGILLTAVQNSKNMPGYGYDIGRYAARGGVGAVAGLGGYVAAENSGARPWIEDQAARAAQSIPGIDSMYNGYNNIMGAMDSAYSEEDKMHAMRGPGAIVPMYLPVSTRASGNLAAFISNPGKLMEKEVGAAAGAMLQTSHSPMMSYLPAYTMAKFSQRNMLERLAMAVAPETVMNYYIDQDASSPYPMLPPGMGEAYKEMMKVPADELTEEYVKEMIGKAVKSPATERYEIMSHLRAGLYGSPSSPLSRIPYPDLQRAAVSALTNATLDSTIKTKEGLIEYLKRRHNITDEAQLNYVLNSIGRTMQVPEYREQLGAVNPDFVSMFKQ